MPKGKITAFTDSMKVRVGRACRRAVVTVASRLCGESFKVVPQDSVRLAGCVVFWFEQDGFKQFITVRSTDLKQADGMVRFPSFFGLLPSKDATESIRAAVHVQLGDVFNKALSPKLLGADRIASVPTFRWQDEDLGIVNPVQLLVWCVQITPQQAQTIQASDDMAVQIIPEFAMGGRRISQAHKLIYQSVQSHVRSMSVFDAEPGSLVKNLDDIIGNEAGTRTIH